MVCVSPTTKGAFKNKIFFDIQTIKYLNLTTVDGVCAGCISLMNDPEASLEVIHSQKNIIIMKKCLFLILVIFTVFFIGCKKYSSNNSITCINETSIKEEVYLSSLFSNSEIVRLETISESIIGGNINKIRKFDNKYFISYDNKAVVVFDHQGKFLHRIEEVGHGPGEYILLNDFDVLPNGNIITQVSRPLFSPLR